MAYIELPPDWIRPARYTPSSDASISIEGPPTEFFPGDYHTLIAEGFYLCRCSRTGRQIYVKEVMQSHEGN